MDLNRSLAALTALALLIMLTTAAVTTIGLQQLRGSGATPGQVPTWTANGWQPADPAAAAAIAPSGLAQTCDAGKLGKLWLDTRGAVAIPKVCAGSIDAPTWLVIVAQ